MPMLILELSDKFWAKRSVREKEKKIIYYSILYRVNFKQKVVQKRLKLFLNRSELFHNLV